MYMNKDVLVSVPVENSSIAIPNILAGISGTTETIIKNICGFYNGEKINRIV